MPSVVIEIGERDLASLTNVIRGGPAAPSARKRLGRRNPSRVRHAHRRPAARSRRFFLGARVTSYHVPENAKSRSHDLYNNDGIDYISADRMKFCRKYCWNSFARMEEHYWNSGAVALSTFRTLVAAAARLSRENVIEDARIVVGAGGLPSAARYKCGEIAARPPLNHQTIEEAAALAAPNRQAAGQYRLRHDVAQKSYRRICDLCCCASCAR